jgi:ubiquitin thioesterase OTU1
MIADAVRSDPFQYSEAVLGKEPGQYAEWIQERKHWGGAIELSILSE